MRHDVNVAPEGRTAEYVQLNDDELRRVIDFAREHSLLAELTVTDREHQLLVYAARKYGAAISSSIRNAERRMTSAGFIAKLHRDRAEVSKLARYLEAEGRARGIDVEKRQARKS